jgi:two-component system, NarL family, response regulator YdfI
MVAIAIFSTDPARRRSLEQMLRGDPTVTIVGLADDPAVVLRLMDQNQLDAVLADAPSGDQLSDWRSRHDRTAFVVLVEGTDPEDAIEAFHAGAGAILPRSAEREEIVAAIKAVSSGLAILPRELMARLLNGDGSAATTLPVGNESLADGLPDDNELPDGNGLPDGNEAAGARLTPRELEVLAAMADGASNKAIARRLDISFHTAKFHVAAILAKLDADSRTEAVTRAAQLGLVML